MSRSPRLHTILGARNADQLRDNLGALEAKIPAEALDRLTSASAIELGFPHDFIADNSAWVLGASDTPETGRDGAAVGWQTGGRSVNVAPIGRPGS